MGWNTDVACSEGGDGESEKRVKMNASLWYLLKIRIRHEIKQYFGKTNVSTHTQKISRRWLETKNSLHVSWESLCWLRAHISICGCMGRKTEGKKKQMWCMAIHRATKVTQMRLKIPWVPVWKALLLGWSHCYSPKSPASLWWVSLPASI